MPRDLSDLLAEAAPRDPGSPDLAAIEARAARRRTGRVGAAVVAVLAAGALAVQAWPNVPDTPIVDEVEDGVVREDGTTVLPLPAPGEVTPAHANGRPVFVVHDDDGEVRVLDAISPHDSLREGLKVLAYCTTSGWFDDPWHSSRFDRQGAWTSGPAPHGLATHEVVTVDEGTVTVGRMQWAPPRGSIDAVEMLGQGCGDTGDPGGLRPQDMVLHADVTDERVPGLVYPERGENGLLLADRPQVPVPGDPVTLEPPATAATDEISAVHVGDRPAFLFGPRQSDSNGVLVRVLDAVDPHTTEFGPKVLAWCRRTGPQMGFGEPIGDAVDLWYSSRFTGDGLALEPRFGVGTDPALGGGVPVGGWGGGPAPTGLGRFPVLDVAMDAVTVGATPLPAPPRVGTTALVEDRCGEDVALWPDQGPADPAVLTDLVLHEPLHPDLWWYPTPARLLGEEPGLPPDELERYLEDTAE